MKTFSPPRISLGIAILMMAVGAQRVSATTITTYTYTGNDFTSASAPYTTGDSVQGSFTIATLGDNLALGPITPTNFSFTDGVTTYDQTGNGVGYFDVETDASGSVVVWEIQIFGHGNTVVDIYNFGTTRFDIGANLGTGKEGQSSAAGTWAVGTVPEPSTFVLIPTGLALAVLARKRKIQGKKGRLDSRTVN